MTLEDYNSEKKFLELAILRHIELRVALKITKLVVDLNNTEKSENLKLFLSECDKIDKQINELIKPLNEKLFVLKLFKPYEGNQIQ